MSSNLSDDLVQHRLLWMSSNLSDDLIQHRLFWMSDDLVQHRLLWLSFDLLDDHVANQYITAWIKPKAADPSRIISRINITLLKNAVTVMASRITRGQNWQTWQR